MTLLGYKGHCEDKYRNNLLKKVLILSSPSISCSRSTPAYDRFHGFLLLPLNNGYPPLFHKAFLDADPGRKGKNPVHPGSAHPHHLWAGPNTLLKRSPRPEGQQSPSLCCSQLAATLHPLSFLRLLLASSPTQQLSAYKKKAPQTDVPTDWARG